MNGIRRRLTVALTLAGLGLAASAPSALAAPGVTVGPAATGLDPVAESTVTVEGSGFTPGGVGIYVAYGPLSAGHTQAAAYYQAKWVRPAMMGGTGDTLLRSDGTFSSTIAVKRTYTDGDGTTVDCYEVQCGVLTMAAHGSADRSQDTATVLSFAATLSVNPTSDLDPAGQGVAVAGSGFNGLADAAHGLYVAQAAVVDGQVLTGGSVQVSPNPDTPTKWKLEADGSFAGDFPVTRSFTYTPRGGGASRTIDCADTQCQVVTFKARTNPTVATLLTRTDIAFEPVPELVATPTSGLDAAGDEVDVEGSGFSAAADPAHGLYVAQAAVVGGQVLTGGSVQVSPNPDTPTKWKLEADGSFAGTLDVVGEFTYAPRGGGAPTTVDCAEVQCEIVTFRARTNPTVATLLTRADIDFAAGGGPGPGPGPGPSGATLSVSPTSGLPADGPSTVTVSGSGYPTDAPGLYVVYGPLAGTDRDAYHSGAKFLPSSTIPSGSFSTTLTVAPTYTTTAGEVVNCTVVQCYVQTMRAHGTADPSGAWSRLVAISFGSTVPTPEPDPVAPPAEQPVPATPGGSAPSGSAPPAAAPELARVRLGAEGRVSLRVSKASTVTFEVRRKVGRRWKVVKRIEMTTDGAGLVARDLPVGEPGRYRVTITAVGTKSGVGSEPVVKKLRVKAVGKGGSGAKGKKAKGGKAKGGKAKSGDAKAGDAKPGDAKLKGGKR